MRTFIFCCTFLILGALQAQNTPQTPSFTAKASVKETIAGQPFEVTFQFENGQGGNFIEPDWESVGISVLGTSQASSISINNGVTQANMRYQYTVAARNAGTITIPPAFIKQGKTSYQTEPLILEVRANPDGIQDKTVPLSTPEEQESLKRQEKLKKQIKTTRI